MDDYIHGHRYQTFPLKSAILKEDGTRLQTAVSLCCIATFNLYFHIRMKIFSTMMSSKHVFRIFSYVSISFSLVSLIFTLLCTNVLLVEFSSPFICSYFNTLMREIKIHLHIRYC